MLLALPGLPLGVSGTRIGTLLAPAQYPTSPPLTLIVLEMTSWETYMNNLNGVQVGE